MSKNEKFIELPFKEEEGGFFDEFGFYITKDGKFWDPDGVFFNKNGFDKHGGFYDNQLIYNPGKGWVDQYQCYEDELPSQIKEVNRGDKRGKDNNRGDDRFNDRRGNNRGDYQTRRHNNYDQNDNNDRREEDDLAEIFGFDIEKTLQEEEDNFCKKTFEKFFKNKDSLLADSTKNQIMAEKPSDTSSFSRKLNTPLSEIIKTPLNVSDSNIYNEFRKEIPQNNTNTLNYNKMSGNLSNKNSNEKMNFSNSSKMNEGLNSNDRLRFNYQEPEGNSHVLQGNKSYHKNNNPNRNEMTNSFYGQEEYLNSIYKK